MNGWQQIKKYRYLLLASAAIIFATLALVFMQYRSVQNAESQSRATLEANLEIHLLELIDQARRDTIDHANHIMHSIRQQRVRTRNLSSLERAFTRAQRRYPEVENFYVVFFESQAEEQTWQAYRFVPPNPDDQDGQKYEGAPVGKLIEDEETTASLRRAWVSIPKQEETTLYPAFDPQSVSSANPKQYFFHTVFELDRLKRQEPLSPVGLLVLSAKPETFPSKNYLKNLVASHEKSDKTLNSLVGKLNYKISLVETNQIRDLASSTKNSETYRLRRFNSEDFMFPNLVFGISSPGMENQTFLNQYTQSSIFLGLCAAVLSMIGLGLTWRATKREMKVAQLKTDFLASISHELKTPLTAIRAFGDLLHSGRARNPERIREYGELIKTESDRLTNLINNILEMSRLERGIRRYRLEENSLSDAVKETVEVFRHTGEASAFKFEIGIPKIPIKASFDKSALKQVLINLLSNAVKYSDKETGSNKIEVLVSKNDSNAIIEIKDYGIGIPPKERRNIFNAFHRASDDEVQNRRGTGLGLAIVREIIKGHGGEIFVESELGKGSVFRLYLPLITSQNTEVEPKILKEDPKWQTF